ncbi:protein of unknown function [Burkholderia multivorans]
MTLLEPTNTHVRRASLGPRTIVKYDPKAHRPSTPIMVGEFVVARRPIRESICTQYTLMDGCKAVASWASYPSEHDCASAMQRHKAAL